jgi:4-methylaminobutanoate oxidase (formaldehyde-forming)
MGAGNDKELKLCGMHALDSCRLEKSYRHFGHDITDEDNVLEAGLGFAVKIDKPPTKFGNFIGRDAVARKKEQGVNRRLLQFKLKDPSPLLYHNEPIFREGKPIGRITSGNYGHFLGGAVGLGYVPCETGETLDELLASSYEIDVAGEMFAAEVSLKPLYDPLSKKVRM